MTSTFAIRRASSSNNRFPIEVRQYLLVNLTFQSLVEFYADDINYSNFAVDSEVINVPFHTFTAPSMPSDPLFERDRTRSQRGSGVEIVPLLYLGQTQFSDSDLEGPLAGQKQSISSSQGNPPKHK